MRAITRLIPSPGAIAIAIVVLGLALSACAGGSSAESSAGVTVAQISGVASISKATLEHWMPVEATVVYQEYPTKPVPKGLIPDPPDYAACIAYLATPPQKLSAEGTKETPAQLKGRCERRYHEVRELTLNTLIVWHWTIGAGQALGMHVSDAEAKARLKEVNPRYFATEAQFQRYLKLTGQTLEDMLFRSKVQLYEVKILAKLEAIEKALPRGLSAKQRAAKLTQLASYEPPNKAWARKTSCRRGYVVSACRQYKGSQPPGIPN
jgi:foldase protein PrsA